MGPTSHGWLWRNVERSTTLGGGMVIALLILIVLILLLGPDAVLNLIVWLVIAALLLGVGIAVVFFYQAHPETVKAGAGIGIVGVLVAIVLRNMQTK